MAFEDGPYVQAACFCEYVVEDKRGVFSLMGLIDRLEQTQEGPQPPKDMPPMVFRTTLALLLKSGEARGRSDLKIVPELPSGETGEPLNASIQFEGDERGANVIADLEYRFELEGLYWFKVYLDDSLVTALPFRVVYNRIVSAPRYG